jgi:signal transduction histidine kinase
VIAEEGMHDDAGSMRSDRRRTVFRTRRRVQVPVPGKKDLSIAIYPLESEGDVLGVVEVLAPTPFLEERVDVLMALVGQSAMVLRSARVRSESERALAGMSALVALASELVWSSTPTEMIRATVTACHRHLGTPVAGLLADRDGWGWFLAGLEGLGNRRRAGLRRALREDGGGIGSPQTRIPALRRRFSEATGCREVAAVRAGGAVVLVGDATSGDADFLDGVASVLQEILPRFRQDARRSSSTDADLGIAWMAHELKGPLAGARAALDLVTETTQEARGKELLRRTNEELGHLSDLIDPLLHWSAGTENLKWQVADLVEVTRQAVASSALAANRERVTIDAPGQVPIRCDPRHLRSAISNVVRNSLAYSPDSSRVRVRVEREGRRARVVVRDRGPGVRPDERRTLFDPFTRGRSGLGRPGSGVGLFIARRVLEAHGGSIHLRPTKVGAMLVMELPAGTSELAS